MKKFIFLLFLLFVPIGSFGQMNAENLTRTLSELQKKSNFPGFAVAIVNQNGALYESAFGFADTKKRTPYTMRTIQPIGSISKTLIGVALMKAVENGELSLDADVNDYLPFAIRHPYFPGEKITLRQLATHTSGILDREEIYAKTYLQTKTNAVPLKNFLADYLTAKGKYYDQRNFAENKPGASFNYTNIGATLAAYIIETKTKTPFSEYTKKFIFKPLSMNATSWFYEAANAARYAALYDAKHKPYRLYSSITYPDGSLHVSVEDLSKYLAEIIRGDAGEAKILSKESFQIMLGKQFSPDKLPQNIYPKEPNQGIFFAHRANGEIGHTGSDFGVSAFMFFNPATKTGRIFITNIDISEDEKLAAQFVEIWKTLESFESLFR